MGREARRVPASWEHPKKREFNAIKGCYEECYQPMYDRSFAQAMRDWYADWEAWERGERPDYCSEENRSMPFWEWDGPPPDPAYYMPEWKDEERTHWQMYEDTSEGTPISPIFATPEELARWLADNGASAFASQTATYEQWLATIKRGWAPSAVFTPGKGMQSGVEAFGQP